MKIRTRTASIFAGLLTMVACVGCGPPDYYTCSGVLTHDGKPMENVEVVFMPDNVDSGRPPFAMTDAEGKFEMTTGRERGIRPGAYTIHLNDPQAEGGGRTSSEEDYLYVVDRYSAMKSDLKYTADSHVSDYEIKADTSEYTGPKVKTQDPGQVKGMEEN